ncbi:MAG: hypothetical protein VB858_01715 [Planctomycetaceae bacterium]
MTSCLLESGVIRDEMWKSIVNSAVPVTGLSHRESISETQLAQLLPLFEEVVAARIVSYCRKQPDDVWRWSHAGKLVMAMIGVFDQSPTPNGVKQLVVITVRAICQIVPTGKCDLD